MGWPLAVRNSARSTQSSAVGVSETFGCQPSRPSFAKLANRRRTLNHGDPEAAVRRAIRSRNGWHSSWSPAKASSISDSTDDLGDLAGLRPRNQSLQQRRLADSVLATKRQDVAGARPCGLERTGAQIMSADDLT